MTTLAASATTIESAHAQPLDEAEVAAAAFLARLKPSELNPGVERVAFEQVLHSRPSGGCDRLLAPELDE